MASSGLIVSGRSREDSPVATCARTASSSCEPPSRSHLQDARHEAGANSRLGRTRAVCGARRGSVPTSRRALHGPSRRNGRQAPRFGCRRRRWPLRAARWSTGSSGPAPSAGFSSGSTTTFHGAATTSSSRMSRVVAIDSSTSHATHGVFPRYGRLHSHSARSFSGTESGIRVPEPGSCLSLLECQEGSQGPSEWRPWRYRRGIRSRSHRIASASRRVVRK